MNDEAIMDRIAKLLAKARGTANEHEAAIFMDKAAEMLAEHNLTEAMIAARESNKDDPIDRHPYENKLYSWHKPLISALGRLYFCTVINEHDRYVFFGREANAKVASAMMEYLVATIRRMSRQYSKLKSDQEDFKRGAASRMSERLMALYHAKAKPAPVAAIGGSNLPALYATELQQTHDFATEFYGGLGKGRRSRMVVKGAGGAAGRAAANTISLNTQVAERRTSRLLR